MKRVTVTVPDDLERELEDYLKTRSAPPSLTAVVQVALREFLNAQRFHEREFRRGTGLLRLPQHDQGSGRSDLSENHDRYLADE